MFKIITIPFDRSTAGFDEDLLNRSVLNKHVKSYKAEFFQDGNNSYWAVFIEYDPVLEKSSAKDTESLDEPQKVLLNRFKVWRKERAEQDGVPPFIIGTNRQMIDIVLNAPRNFEALKSIEGWGKGKSTRYRPPLFARERSGEGNRLAISMLDAQVQNTGSRRVKWLKIGFEPDTGKPTKTRPQPRIQGVPRLEPGNESVGWSLF